MLEIDNIYHMDCLEDIRTPSPYPLPLGEGVDSND